MAKKIKMILYGEPGAGKSVFAGNAPKAFFITTDGNYEWLEGLVPDFDEANHVQVSSYSEFDQLLPKLSGPEYAKYDTLVLDLVEDLYKWASFELIKKNRVNHISELGDYGKGYDLLRRPFKAAISKFIAIDKNIILLSHESTVTVKSKKGTETTKYQPSSEMSIEKVWDEFTGQVRFCIRCVKDYETDEDGNTVINRMLHLQTQPDEYGTFRLPDPNSPAVIPLDWDVFAEVVGLNAPSKPEPKKQKVVPITHQESSLDTTTPEAPKPKASTKQVVTKSTPTKVVEQPKEEIVSVVDETLFEEPVEEVKVEEPKVVTPKSQPKKVEPKVEQPQTTETKQDQSKEDKVAALRAKLAAMKANK